MTDNSEQQEKHTDGAKEARFTFPSVSMVLVLIAFAFAAYMAYLNYATYQLSSAQLLRSQQAQEQAQIKLMDQYSKFLEQQSRLSRFENSFQVRQKHYTQFMGALSDTWTSTSRHHSEGLDQALQNLAKAYYGLEPFLEAGGRHYLKKRIAIFHNLAKQLAKGDTANQQLVLEDKTTMNRMIEDFQDYLYPLLFEPNGEQNQEQTNEADG